MSVEITNKRTTFADEVTITNMAVVGEFYIWSTVIDISERPTKLSVSYNDTEYEMNFTRGNEPISYDEYNYALNNNSVRFRVRKVNQSASFNSLYITSDHDLEGETISLYGDYQYVVKINGYYLRDAETYQLLTALTTRVASDEDRISELEQALSDLRIYVDEELENLKEYVDEKFEEAVIQLHSVSISGTLDVGEVLTAVTDPENATVYKYQWYKVYSGSSDGGSPITGATGKTYTVLEADRSYRFKVRAYSNSEDYVESTYSAVVPGWTPQTGHLYTMTSDSTDGFTASIDYVGTVNSHSDVTHPYYAFDNNDSTYEAIYLSSIPNGDHVTATITFPDTYKLSEIAYKFSSLPSTTESTFGVVNTIIEAQRVNGTWDTLYFKRCDYAFGGVALDESGVLTVPTGFDDIEYKALRSTLSYGSSNTGYTVKLHTIDVTSWKTGA